MIRLLSILLLLIFASSLQASEPNYAHKQLKKELMKKWELDYSCMNEMKSLSDQSMNKGKFYKVENKGVLIGYVYVGRIISCRADGCARDKSTAISGDYEYFDAFILYDSTKTIETVKVYNYQATHGHEVCSRGWLKQFIGFSSDKKELEVGKTIDGISGATISVYALTDEVTYITNLLNLN